MRLQNCTHCKGTKVNRKRNRRDFKLEIAIKERIILVMTDTGADMNVLPKTIADKLKLPLEGSRMKSCPCGEKLFRVAGKSEGNIVFGDS